MRVRLTPDRQAYRQFDPEVANHVQCELTVYPNVRDGFVPRYRHEKSQHGYGGRAFSDCFQRVKVICTEGSWISAFAVNPMDDIGAWRVSDALQVRWDQKAIPVP